MYKTVFSKSIPVKVVDMMRGSQIVALVAGRTLAVSVALLPTTTSAAPSPETARQCLRAAYMLYPYKRPGAAPMNGERLTFFRNCMANPPSSPTPEPPPK